MNKFNRLEWYYHRLSSMGMGEIVYRAQQALSIQLEKRGAYSYPQEIKSSWSAFQSNETFEFFFSPLEKEEIQTFFSAHCGQNLHWTLSAAEQLLDNHIDLFGYSFQLEPPINWHQDPLTGRSWPSNAFWGDIDIRDGRTIGGVKWVWELNRHHHLVTMAKAFFLSGDDRFAQSTCHQLNQWIDSNPPGQGVNWTSALELAIRIINWSWTLKFLQSSAALNETLFNKIEQSVQAQGTYIWRHLSKFSSANNHLVGEAAGLFFAGHCFPELKDAEKWRQQGLKIMAEQLPLQILEDGAPAEQTIEYFTFLLDFNLQVWRLAKLNNLPVPSIWHERLRASAEFIRAVMRSDGTFPLIGDGDDAWVVRLDETGDSHRLPSLLTSIALELDLDASISFKDEKSFWIYGKAAVTNKTSNSNPPLTSRLFATGGIAVLRHKETLLTFDCGPLGFLSTAAHGHADALSMTLSVGKRPLLIDPNTYAYQEGYEWRDYFRSTAAHNTIVVNGKNQSAMQGAFLWGSKAETTLLTWQAAPTEDRVAAQHDGYRADGVIHRRELRFIKPDRIEVVDTLEGEGQHQIAQYWHFPAGTSIEIRNFQAAIDTGGQTAVFLLPQHQNLQLKIIEGETSPIQGWVSPHYGHKIPAPVLTLFGTVKLPLILTTFIQLQKQTPNLTIDPAVGKSNDLKRKI